MTHIDDWLDAQPTPDELVPAKAWLEHFRRPAHKKNQQWLDERVLTCLYKNKRHRVVGCSRMGDVWLTTRLVKPDGYEERVNVDECSRWLMEMSPAYVARTGSFNDLDSPWRIIASFELLGNAIPTVVDGCNIPLFSAHTYAGVKERIVEDHNKTVVPVKGDWGLDDDEEEEIPNDAHLHDDPMNDGRIAHREGWCLIDKDESGVIQIQRDDEKNIFPNDAAAIAFVRAKGTPYHQKAIAIHDSNPDLPTP